MLGLDVQPEKLRGALRDLRLDLRQLVRLGLGLGLGLRLELGLGLGLGSRV